MVVKKCGREGGRGRGGCLRGGLFNNFQRTFGLVFIKRASERERERETKKNIIVVIVVIIVIVI